MKRYSKDKYQGNEYAGVVTGLAWTSVGGEILLVETSLSRGKGEKLTLTGNLGDVMKESAMLAKEYIQSHAEELEINPEIFQHWNIHVHVPEGAIQKMAICRNYNDYLNGVGCYTTQSKKQPGNDRRNYY